MKKAPNDKHQKKLDEKQVIMNNGKNEYLIKINVANRLKDKYYYQDVPEILDYLQELNEDRVELMNKLLKMHQLLNVILPIKSKRNYMPLIKLLNKIIQN